MENPHCDLPFDGAGAPKDGLMKYVGTTYHHLWSAHSRGAYCRQLHHYKVPTGTVLVLSPTAAPVLEPATCGKMDPRDSTRHCTLPRGAHQFHGFE